MGHKKTQTARIWWGVTQLKTICAVCAFLWLVSFPALAQDAIQKQQQRMSSSEVEERRDAVMRLGAMHLEAASRPDMRLVDAGRAPGLAATLLVWDLESEGGTRLVGAVEFQITGTDRVLQTRVVRASEPVSATLPGDLAAAAGRLLRHFASEGLTLVASEPDQMK